MDASPSASGNGFDAALKALEDLDAAVVDAREEKPAAPPPPAIEPVSTIGFSDADDAGEPAMIVAVPIVEIAELSDPHAAVAAEPAPVQPDRVPAEPGRVVVGATSRFTKVAIGLGLLSSAVSAAGLVVAERTIMSAQLVVADARERQQQLEQVSKLISDLRLVRDKQVELLRAQQAQLAATPVTSADLQHKMDALQAGLLARDPLNDVVSAIRAGQSDTGARFNEFGMKIARLEAAVGGGH